MPRILIIDDEKAIRNTLKEILEFENYKVDQAEDGPAGLDLLIQQKYDVVLCDIRMPKMDGLEVLTRAQAMGTDAAFIMVSAHGSIDTAVEATKKGAYDFLPKPPDLNRLLVTVRNALDRTKLVTETKTLKKKLSVTKGSEMVGSSAALGAVRKAIEKVAPTDARVLITGPNGAGKEMVARQLHELSNRASGPMVEVNCAAIPSELIESELFGHEKGSFTSAVKQRIGKFEQADGGTLFLDEIGDMSLSAQAKVLRALQENKITRVGGEKEISVNVRVLAATNKDLLQEIADKNFREDLYHRLSVILIQVPALNDRREDIPELIQKFLNDIAADYGNKPKKIDAAALEYLKGLDWRGNIRELRNVVERLVIMSDDTISEGDAKAFAGK
ncbi:sigma-54-dependent transcriptional regulator [Hymenobacter negativus]|uniref:Sigma-54-dependent Fis family transcriptional regulator n=1 Tax=Hymenobacter negativus TaxID=2795026 RepID=A0ABS0QAT7_9BACT|nr:MULTISPECIES: sigma-54 dependent transcriptional regulator [Bacteria]MBH8559768.1 sigma-54-dependent Fis family transcriptional regulator [Hymenobacter negativus]MBH8569654.1 sigma-54-dependent Fis family transcriptional regulator [Hymenobacter negativus]MBR7209390.1 sigma-54-dependent Fis family transcriptional regulator [Microvirga sp. STS02]